MIRQTARSLALVAAGLLLAGGAWGQVLRQSTSDAPMVALEYFGVAGGREILSAGFDVDTDPADRTVAVRPYVALTPGTPITTGNVADITFTLTGATFSQTAGPANLDLRTACTAASAEAGLSVSVSSGGARGDSSVTYRVEATADAGLTTSQSICFWVPNVRATLANLSPPGTPAAAQMRGVAVTATLTQGVTNSAPFPARISGPSAGDVDADEDGSIAGSEVGTSPNTDRTVFLAAPALATSLGSGGMARVALADRSVIASGGTPDPSASDPSAAMMGLLVGTLSVAASDTATSIWQLTGREPVYSAADGIHSSLGGQVMVSVGGPFQDGDKVVFATGDSPRQARPEDGMASTSLQLAVGSTPIVYVPGGTGILKPSTFAAAAKYAFNSLDNNSGLPIMTSTGTIGYAGLNVEGYAYGVVRGGGMDSSYVRVTCEAPSGVCQVFADCTDQDGMDYFGGPVPVPAGATGVVSSDMIAAALGGGWDSGRGHCEIHSTHPLAVQHMVRSAHALINNSAVVGRGLDENTDSGIAAVQAVVDDICASVGQNVDDMTADADVDTACVAVDLYPVTP